MLLGEDLGGRHERPLVATLDPGEQRAERHDRLAGADVALQQPVHRERARPGRARSPPRACRWALVSSKLRPSTELGDEIAGACHRVRSVVPDAPRVALGLVAAHHDLELQPEQLVESEALPGGGLLGPRLGMVDAGEAPRGARPGRARSGSWAGTGS